MFHEPTTAAILGNNSYVLANSYLGAYNANKESVEGIKDKLGSVTILAYKLNRNALTRLCLHYPIGQSPVE